MLYLQATGSGEGPYTPDIMEWSKLRTIPSMAMYLDNMNLYHVSYATQRDNPDGTGHEYIRARRYMPDRKAGLKGTDVPPDVINPGLFAPGVPHRITVIKKDQEIFMHIRNAEKEFLCRWKNDALPPIHRGYIGLRQMSTRIARYRDFRVSTPAAGNNG